MKLKKINRWHYFFCPGCNHEHSLPLNVGAETKREWGWNGDLDKPTITPSIFVNRDGANPSVPQCHSFVVDGQIRFLPDCTHSLAGKTVDLPEMKPDRGEYLEEG